MHRQAKTHSSFKKPAVWLPTIQTNGGADRYTERLAKALDKRGIKTEITWLPHRAEYAPWSVRLPNPPKWANIVHVPSFLPARFIPMHLPLVATFHHCKHDPELASYKGIMRRLYHYLWLKKTEMKIIKKADIVTCVSYYTAYRVKKDFNYKKAIPIYNWINTEEFSKDKKEEPHNPFRLLFVGKVRKSKGSDSIIKIMHRLGDDFELYYTGYIREFGFKKRLPKNMISLGRLNGNPALVAAYQDCDALLFPTHSEGFGLVALEAQACGRPVIASHNSSLPEVVSDGETGILCETNNIESFVESARKMKSCPSMWKKMTINARKLAINKFSESNAIDRYIEIYNLLCK